MAVWTGTNINDLIDWSTHPLDGTGDTGHSMSGLAGDDQIKGSNTLQNIIDGGTGNDRVTGGNVNDILIGGDGNDTIIGNAGNDVLTGNAGVDKLDGGNGSDILHGNQGNDVYQVRLNDTGNDTISEDLNQANSPGNGGGTADEVDILDAPGANLLFYQSGNDLLITDTFDMSDGVMSDQVTIQNFFLGGNHVVEFAFGDDGAGWNLTGLLSPSPFAPSSGLGGTAASQSAVTVDGNEVHQLQAVALHHDQQGWIL